MRANNRRSQRWHDGRRGIEKGLASARTFRFNNSSGTGIYRADVIVSLAQAEEVLNLVTTAVDRTLVGRIGPVRLPWSVVLM